jgi:hypothetical protein
MNWPVANFVMLVVIWGHLSYWRYVVDAKR